MCHSVGGVIIFLRFGTASCPACVCFGFCPMFCIPERTARFCSHLRPQRVEAGNCTRPPIEFTTHLRSPQVTSGHVRSPQVTSDHTTVLLNACARMHNGMYNGAYSNQSVIAIRCFVCSCGSAPRFKILDRCVFHATSLTRVKPNQFGFATCGVVRSCCQASDLEFLDGYVKSLQVTSGHLTFLTWGRPG